ncbi:uncharacterized protein LOC113279558 [Papaver somniferum]|uniref:uncharacterized protein LOC113279558 n=1 Tax=Papaver somniferum TaxID=3469 RepID=UPI000E700ED9|nr:uncharacterized protein LOC113279558 [Papaver somniferum]
MASLMNKLVSPQQVTYIKGRNIHEKILFASELVNEMKKKRRGGNLSLKLDISQAYDSVSWKHLLKVLQRYGFSVAWCDWLKVLISSDKVSVMVNGGPNGFFSMHMGLKKGDPLSPILFVLMEEVLGRGLTKLVETRKLQPMVIRNVIAPTHLLFSDDIFTFSNGSKKSIENLLKLIEDYQSCSGQIINKSKSKCLVDGCSLIRKSQISDMLQMELTSFQDKYLGVIIHPGRIKSASVWSMVEMMQGYLAVWKGDAEIRKAKTISWRRVCTPFNEGGLGIRRLSNVNKSLLMKMMWKLLTSKEEWSLFFAARFKDKNGQWTSQCKLSSVWPGLKWAWQFLKSDVRWIIGNGENISVYFDTWTGESPLIDRIGFTEYVKNNLQMKVKDLIQNNEWSKFSTPAEVNKVRHREPIIHWPSQVWKTSLHPGISSNIWKLQQGVFVDDQMRTAQGYSIASTCCLGHRSTKFSEIKECFWLNPPRGFVLFCCDGAAAGNPGLEGFGIIARDHACTVIGTISGGLVNGLLNGQ